MQNGLSIIQCLKNRVLNLETAFWDKKLGIRTLGVNPGPLPSGAINGDACYYQAKCYSTIRACLRPVALEAKDVFFDIGSGAGRVLCVVAQRRIRKCVGVELSEALCKLARDNAQTLRGKQSPIEIVAGDAALVDYSDGTVFFFFNPFGPQTLDAVLRRIRESFLCKPRLIRCIYLNPKAHDVFQTHGWLRLIAQKSFGTGGTLAHYYSSAE